MTAHSTITAGQPLDTLDRDTRQAAAPLSRAKQLWWPLAAMALAVLVTRGAWLGNPVADIDEQLYSFIGWRMQFGELPYVDWWDRKPFGLFAIFGLAHWIAGPSALAYQVLAALVTLGGAMLVHRLARPLVDSTSAVFAGLLYVVLMAAYASYSAQSEVFHVPMVLAMAVLVAEQRHPHATRRALIAMVIGGLALQVKYTVLPQCLVLGCWALWGAWRRDGDLARLVRLGSVFAGLGLLPTALVSVFYAVIGQWDAFFFANFVSFFDRLPAQAGRFDAAHALFLMPVGVLVVLGAYAAARMARPRDGRLYGLYAALFAGALATAYLPSTVYPYYFAALVPGAVLLAVPLLDRSGPFKLVPAIALVAGATFLLSLPERYQASRAMAADITQLAADTAPYVGPETCLFVYDGPTVLYRLTNSCVPSRVVYPDHLNNALETKALGVDQADEVARIMATRPGAIVTADKALAPQNRETTALVVAAIEANYRPLTSADVHGRVHTVWVRSKQNVNEASE